MYLPDAFAERDPRRLGEFLAAFPLGLLVAQSSAEGIVANLLPFEYLPPMQADARGGGGVLRAHLARANPVWQVAADAQVLVVFQGPQGYVSPGWYPGKAEHGKVVPTWNYTMVQARGVLRVFDDAAWLRAQVESLTARHEAARPAPWSPGDAPAGYIDALLRAIVGIEIAVTGLLGKWKLSQNRGTEDLRGVRDALRAGEGKGGPVGGGGRVGAGDGQRPDPGALAGSAEQWMAAVLDAHLRDRERNP